MTVNPYSNDNISILHFRQHKGLHEADRNLVYGNMVVNIIAKLIVKFKFQRMRLIVVMILMIMMRMMPYTDYRLTLGLVLFY